MMKQHSILVTDINELAGLATVRSLGRAGFRVYGAYSSGIRRPAALSSRFLNKAVVCPDPWREHVAFVDWLRQQLQSGQYDGVLPVTEASIVAVAALRAEAVANICFLTPADAALRFSLSKFHSAQAALRAGVDIPETLFLWDCDGKALAGSAELESWNFPYLIKSDNSFGDDAIYRKGRRYLVRTPEERELVLDECRGFGGAAMAQRRVPGHGAGAFLLRWENRVYMRFAHRRLHETPYTGGWSSLRESVADGPLCDVAERLISAIAYEGIAMVEFRRDVHTGRIWFLEINGRPWGSMALAIHAGADFPAAFAQCVFEGRPRVIGGPIRYGLRCANLYPGELGFLLSVWRARKVPGSGAPPFRQAALDVLLHLVNPIVRRDFLWADDPWPAFVQTMELLRELARRKPSRLSRCLESSQGEPAMVSLAPDAKILFICAGNICRSPFAKAYFQMKVEGSQLARVEAASAGLNSRAGQRAYVRFSWLFKRYGVDLSSHRATPLDAAMLQRHNFVFVMENWQCESLIKRFPEAANKIWLLGAYIGNIESSIPDPYDLEPLDAKLVFDKIRMAIDRLIELRAGPCVSQKVEGHANRSLAPR